MAIIENCKENKDKKLSVAKGLKDLGGSKKTNNAILLDIVTNHEISIGCKINF